MREPRWHTVTPSQYEWERAALDYLREVLPDHDPYRAWSNFEFQTPEGAIYEVDLLVLTKAGFWLVEIKSFPGEVSGDAGHWLVRRPDGGLQSLDNPLLLANRKAKALKGLLERTKAGRKQRPPFLEAAVFLSHEQVRCALDGIAGNRIFRRDDRDGRNGIRDALVNRVGPGLEAGRVARIDTRMAKAVGRAVEELGIRPSQKKRRIGDYLLTSPLGEGPGYQDWLGKHASLEGVYARIRQYLVEQAADEAERQRLRRAAAREFKILQSLEHPGILSALHYVDHEYGPAILFRYEKDAVTLDHYLAAHWGDLSVDRKLEFLRQLIYAVQYAHSQKVIHRALSPRSILVLGPQTSAPQLKIFNWQVSVRDARDTVHTKAAASVSGDTTSLEALVEMSDRVFMAPEAHLGRTAVGPALDVFSLGAIAYQLFSGKLPAPNQIALIRKLKQDRALKLSAVLDGASPALEALVEDATQSEHLNRLDSVGDLLASLELVEEELTSPSDPEPGRDPLDARKGEALDHGLVVLQVLGKGSTSLALLVERERDEQKGEAVLKVALDEDAAGHLRDEADALRKLRSQYIVELEQELEVGGRTCLLLARAGEETLADRLRTEGRLGFELLQRFGEDLLQAVSFLEKTGVAHRDIKPDNIGIRSYRKQALQLVLFDFSLCRAPLDHLNVGTLHYLDPFLVHRPRAQWDLAAERYAAAVTLFEMATGVLPQWGDGQTDPATTDVELDLQPEQFDPSLREPLSAFFTRALHRDFTARFDNADEMLVAWRRCFEGGGPREIQPSLDFDEREDLSLDSPIALLGLSTRAENALDRADVLTVRGLLELPPREIRFMRGVGQKTRLDIVEKITKLRSRFPEVVPQRAPSGAPQPRGAKKKTASTGTTTTTPKDAASVDLETLPLETILAGVIGRRVTGRGEAQYRARLAVLDQGDEDTPSPVGDPLRWPSQTELARHLGVSHARVQQAIAKDRERWLKDPRLTAVRGFIAEALRPAGGVQTVAELIDTLLTLPTELESGAHRAAASAVARAAVEAEQGLESPRFRVHRKRTREETPLVVVALSMDDQRYDAIVQYAVKLGDLADQLAEAEPLLAPTRVVERLAAIEAPAPPSGALPLSSDRLVALAASASTKAALSSRGEIYPRGLAAKRALRLAAGAITGVGLELSSPTVSGGGGSSAESDDTQRDTDKKRNTITVEELRRRVASRYPEAEPLPDRPQLDHLVSDADVGLELEWDPDSDRYRRRVPKSVSTTGSTIMPRLETRRESRGRTHEISPEIAQAKQLEDRLRDRLDSRAFLVLTVEKRLQREAAQELESRFGLTALSLDHLLIEALEQAAAALDIAPATLFETDAEGPGTPDWPNLLTLVRQVMDSIEQAILARTAPTLLVNCGLLARFDQMAFLERLRDRVGTAAGGPLVWVLVAADEQSDLPRLNGKEIPLISPGQRVRLARDWVRNVHRGADRALGRS